MTQDDDDDDFEKLIPQSLDQIITQNRDKASLRMATDAEMEGLPSLIEQITYERPVKHGAISDWRLIRFDFEGDDDSPYFIIGYRNGKVLSTSGVRAIEYKNGQGFAVTKSSLYRLEKKSEQDPDQHQIFHICNSLWEWGLGNELGAASISY